MCHQINYTLPCEHVRTQTIYCADATPVSSSSSSSSKGKGKSSSSTSGSGSSKHGSSSSRSHGKGKHSSSSHSGNGGGSSSGSDASSSRRRKPCRNLTQETLPYPTPPSFAGSPMTAASSPLLPKCPLENCPFEMKNRCWYCCWCGKWNDQGRCGCIMIVEGNHIQCEHICCETCEAAPSAEMGFWGEE